MTESHPWGHPRVHPGSINSRKLFQATFLSAGHTTRTSNAAETSIILMGTWRLQLLTRIVIEHWLKRKHLSNYLSRQVSDVWSLDISVCFYFGFQYADLQFNTFWWHSIKGWSRYKLRHSKFFGNYHKMICDSVNCSLSVSMERITGCKGSQFSNLSISASTRSSSLDQTPLIFRQEKWKNCAKTDIHCCALRQWCENRAWKVCHSLGRKTWLKIRFLHKISRKLSQQTYQSLTGGLVYHRNRQRCAGLRVIQSKLYVLLREDSQIDRTFNVVWRCKA